MKRSASKQIAGKSTSRFGFIGDIVAELRKVVWPTRREASYLTLLVIIVAVIAGIVLGAIDYAFAYLVESVFVP